MQKKIIALNSNPKSSWNIYKPFRAGVFTWFIMLGLTKTSMIDPLCAIMSGLGITSVNFLYNNWSNFRNHNK
ncbi:MAG: hypothetical protein PHV30_10430 [Candidatus Margulisbacteria bacterium]|nr:hypothetical protein [Candidatus Margulisiibacteriota bacterium]